MLLDLVQTVLIECLQRDPLSRFEQARDPMHFCSSASGSSAIWNNVIQCHACTWLGHVARLHYHGAQDSPLRSFLSNNHEKSCATIGPRFELQSLHLHGTLKLQCYCPSCFRCSKESGSIGESIWTRQCSRPQLRYQCKDLHRKRGGQ